MHKKTPPFFSVNFTGGADGGAPDRAQLASTAGCRSDRPRKIYRGQKVLFKQRAVSLLELLLVLGVAMMIILGALKFERYHQNQMFVSEQQEALSMTLLLMNQYYLNHCHDADLSSKTLADLKTWAQSTSPAMFTPQELAKIPSNFSIQFVGQVIQTPVVHTIYKFGITGDYSTLNTEQLEQLAAELNADNHMNPLAWTRPPRQFIFKETTTDSLWISSMNMQSRAVKADQSHSFCS